MTWNQARHSAVAKRCAELAAIADAPGDAYYDRLELRRHLAADLPDALEEIKRQGEVIEELVGMIDRVRHDLHALEPILLGVGADTDGGPTEDEYEQAIARRAAAEKALSLAIERAKSLVVR